MNIDRIKDFETKFINKEFSKEDVKAEFKKYNIGFCYEASEIAEDTEFKSLLLDIEDKKIKSWLDKVIKKINKKVKLSDVINGTNRKFYVSSGDKDLRISEVNYYQNINSFYMMLLERYCNSTILSTEPYKSVLTTIFKNYQVMLYSNKKIYENDSELSRILKKIDKNDSRERKVGNNQEVPEEIDEMDSSKGNVGNNQEVPKNIDEMLELLRQLNEIRLSGERYVNLGKDLNGKTINEESISGYEDFSQRFLIYSLWLEQIRKNYSSEDKKVQECQEIINACSKFLKTAELHISKYRKTSTFESRS